MTGIEPASPAWEAGVLPMNYICVSIYLAEILPANVIIISHLYEIASTFLTNSRLFLSPSSALSQRWDAPRCRPSGTASPSGYMPPDAICSCPKGVRARTAARTLPAGTVRLKISDRPSILCVQRIQGHLHQIPDFLLGHLHLAASSSTVASRPVPPP